MSNKDNGFLEGNGIIILILFFLLMGGGFGGWGANNVATQESLTRAELYDGLNTQDVRNSIANLSTVVNTGFDNVQNALCCGFNGVNSNIANLGYQMATNCCDIKTAIHAEGEETRSLIQANTIQQLRDEINAKDRELLTTGLVTAQTLQTSNLENFMRTLFNGCGCCN